MKKFGKEVMRKGRSGLNLEERWNIQVLQKNREERVQERENYKIQRYKTKIKSETRDEGHTIDGKQTGHSISSLLILEKVRTSELKLR